MKKSMLLMLTLLISLCIGFTSCNSCSGGSAPEEKDSTKLTEVADTNVHVALNVEHAIAMDRQAMYLKFGDEYRWFETDMRLPHFLDEEDATSEPLMIVNIFQSIVESGNGADTYVWKFQHFPDGTVLTDSIHGFWIENYALNEEVITVKYEDAFTRMMESNAPKPHSRNAVLRNPIGPVAVNAQWIFGNISEQIWVDAVTGDVQTSNPAFPKEKGFKMPLGEWP